MAQKYIGGSAWRVSFKRKDGTRFRKAFKSEASMDRAMLGWRNRGGMCKWIGTGSMSVIRSRGKRR